MKLLRGPAGALLLALLGGVLGLLSASRPWLHALVEDPALGRTTVTAVGRQAAPVVPAVSLVALAGGVALLPARTLGRRLIGVLLVLVGAAQAAAVVSTVRSPTAGVADLVGRATATVGVRGTGLDVTSWPWLAVLGAALIVAAGALAVLRARAWAAPSTRFGASSDGAGGSASPEAGRVVAPVDPWDALSRGEQPTR